MCVIYEPIRLEIWIPVICVLLVAAVLLLLLRKIRLAVLFVRVLHINDSSGEQHTAGKRCCQTQQFPFHL